MPGEETKYTTSSIEREEMKLLNLQVAQSGTNQPGNILRFVDSRRGRSVLSNESRGNLECGDEPRCFGWAHAGRPEQLRRGSGSEPAKAAIRGFEEANRRREGAMLPVSRP